jgi:EAL domain-containing protein (putative c-di-GMP-specific phosphodiesterase class I)
VRELATTEQLRREPAPNTSMGLSNAIDRHELRLVFQPVLRLSDGYVVAHEALVRRLHPTRGMLTASEIIPEVDGDDALDAVSSWVFTHACRALVRATSLGDRGISVNVAASEVGVHKLLDRVTTTLSKTGLPAERLGVEIPATALKGSPREVTKELAALRELGVTVAADGARPKVTTAKERAHVDVLKLHPSALDSSGASDASAWSRLIKGGLERGVEIVAKGVETPEQLDEARRIGCTLGQGLLCGPPARDMVSANWAPRR